MNKYDSLSQRSFIPVGLNISINGTFVAAGAGTLFFNDNKFIRYIFPFLYFNQFYFN